MKKYIVIILSVMLIISCSNNGLENQAKEQLKTTMKEMLKNPDSAKLTNVKTVLNNDSLCIIHFTCKAQNGFGGFSSSRHEYIYLKSKSNKNEKPTYKEAVFDLEETESVIKKAHDFDKSVAEIANKDLKQGKTAEEIERDSINSIYLIALGNMIFNGREVDNDDGDDIEL